MDEYHKIQTVYKRDPATKHRTLLMGEYSIPAFEYLANNCWIWTEKVDGTNIRVRWNRGIEVEFGGRTDNAQVPTYLYKRLQELFPLEKFDKNISETDELILYGEGYGAKIQKGGGNYKSDGVDFVLFDVKVGDWWLTRPDMFDVAQKLDIPWVPLIGNGTLTEMVRFAQNGFSSAWGDFPAEGIVARPETELFDRSLHRIITKIKTKDFPND